MLLTAPRRIGFVSLLLCLGIAGVTQARNFWDINAAPTSVDTTGTAVPFAAGEAETGARQMPPMLAQTNADGGTAAGSDAPEVDESALRYFARIGDTKRLEIEIARLRALYPDWTPPADPLAVPPSVDEKLEAIWELYAQGKLAEARQAIARRQAEEPGWQPPADLLSRLALAEARERLVNASTLNQYSTVISVASENPELLTCSEVDVLWRVAEAFARTDRAPRARDAYGYILTNCDDAGERLATMQNATQLLPRPLVDELLALERFDATGAGEFAGVRDDLARDALARGGEEGGAEVPAEELDRVRRLADENKLASDARLLGWYYLRRENQAEAETWFRSALAAEPSADAAQGLALVLIARQNYAEAEDVIHPWRAESDDTRNVYLAAVANLLGIEPRAVLSAEVLNRIVAEVMSARDVPSARQLGWYARAWEQHQTALQWFGTALKWSPDDEPSAYGLALTHLQLGDAAGLAEIKRLWAGRSDRIRDVGTGAADVPPSPPAAPPVAAAPAKPRDAVAEPAPKQAAAPRRRGCTGGTPVEGLSPEAALDRGWCLMDANRPMEAARAFGVALASPSESIRRDAGYGQSLAYLRAGLVDDAALAAAKAPQDGRRVDELQANILAQRALGAFEHGRYVEAIIALDQRALIAAERIDLMVLRGYAYLKLNRVEEARRIFEAAAGTGSRDGLRGLAEVRNLTIAQ